MRIKSIIIPAAIAALALAANSVSAQITIKMPNIKISGQKPKTDGPTTKDAGTVDNGKSTAKGAEPLYRLQRPNGTPVLLKDSIYVQAKTHNEYWKMPNQRSYSSWVPLLRFSHFYNNEKPLNYTVEYFNPDGTPWYSEKLEQGNTAADRTVLFQSPSPYGGILDTKSTAATGIFSFKIIDQDTKTVLFQGKFKVGKFSTSYNPQQEKNKADFFVDHDWLMPFGVIGFHHAIDEVGGMPPLISVWMKGPVEASELEGRVFYKGAQIASTKDGDGASGVGDYDARYTQFAPSHSPLNIWKRWQFQWGKLRFDNNGTFNRDRFPGTHYADKNPGDYVVKIYRNGEQVRELGFTIDAAGRIAVPPYSDQIFLPYYRVVVPVKVIGTAEKWNANEWKTGSFYGNPLNGFSAP